MGLYLCFLSLICCVSVYSDGSHTNILSKNGDRLPALSFPPFSQALNFNRQVEDFESWMDDVEGQLSSEDHGKDIVTVTNLLKKHQLLEDDIGKHQVNM